MEEEQNSLTKFKGTGLTTKERRYAQNRYEEYRKNYHIEQISDLGLLETLVFRETLQERVRKKISVLEKKVVKFKRTDIGDKDKPKPKSETIPGENIPRSLITFLNDNLEIIIELKEKLGLLGKKEKEDAYEYIKQTKKKFRLWEEANPLTRKTTCPKCSFIFFLHIRTDKYQEFVSPFFKDKILRNDPLWDLHKKGKITEEDVASVLGVHIDYVKWLKKKFYNKASDK